MEGLHIQESSPIPHSKNGMRHNQMVSSCRQQRHLRNCSTLKSLATSTVPHMEKKAKMRPVPKVPAPQQPAEYRPKSIISALSSVVKRMVVSTYLYPYIHSFRCLLQATHSSPQGVRQQPPYRFPNMSCVCSSIIGDSPRFLKGFQHSPTGRTS